MNCNLVFFAANGVLLVMANYLTKTNKVSFCKMSVLGGCYSCVNGKKHISLVSLTLKWIRITTLQGNCNTVNFCHIYFILLYGNKKFRIFSKALFGVYDYSKHLHGLYSSIKREEFEFYLKTKSKPSMLFLIRQVQNGQFGIWHGIKERVKTRMLGCLLCARKRCLVPIMVGENMDKYELF